jgi:ADP-ribose pyrophosphatase
MMGEESEIAWSGKHFRVLRTQVAYPDGSTHTHEQVDAPDVVRVYGVNEGAVLLTDEYRADLGGRVHRVPAGRVEVGEASDQAARREFREEAGYEVGRIDLLRTSVPILKFRHKAWHFAASELTLVGQSLEYGEDIRLVWIPFEKVEKVVFGGLVREDSIAMTLLILARRHRLGESLVG